MDARFDPENPLSVVHKLARAIRVAKLVAAVFVGVGLGSLFNGWVTLGLVELSLGAVLWVFVVNKLTAVRIDTARYAEELQRASEETG